MTKFWTDASESDWHQVSSMMGVAKTTEGRGSQEAQWFIGQLVEEADRSGDSFSAEQVEFLGKHIFSVDPTDVAAIQDFQDKVIRHARSALRRDLKSGAATVKVGFMNKWPQSWFDRYRVLIESNNPMMVSGVLQNAFAPKGKMWKP